MNQRMKKYLMVNILSLFLGCQIAKQYVKGRFWIDLFASLPFDYIVNPFITGGANETVLSMLGLLKLARVLRLSRLITFMNLKDDIKMSLKLVKLVFFLVLYIHFIGCMWFFIAKQDQQWIPPLDYVWVKTDIYEQSNIKQYASSLYHSMLVLSGNDIGPRDTFELFLLTFLLLTSAIINANIFGNIAVLLQQMNRKATKFQEKMENASSTMKNLKLPDNLQKEIQSYLTYTHNNLEQQNELDAFLQQLSPSLKFQVRKCILKESL